MSDLTPSPDKSGEITARLEAATPGPWTWVDHDNDEAPSADSSRFSLRTVTEYPTQHVGPLPIFVIAFAEEIREVETSPEVWARPDAEFIAAAPEDIRYLLGLRNAVLALHAKVTAARNTPGLTYSSCAECSDPEEGMSVPWPCATVRALGETGQ